MKNACKPLANENASRIGDTLVNLNWQSNQEKNYGMPTSHDN